jgi:hypothetical protein
MVGFLQASLTDISVVFGEIEVGLVQTVRRVVGSVECLPYAYYSVVLVPVRTYQVVAVMADDG